MVKRKVIINNRSHRHGSEGTVIDQRMHKGLMEYLVQFSDSLTFWFYSHEIDFLGHINEFPDESPNDIPQEL